MRCVALALTGGLAVAGVLMYGCEPNKGAGGGTPTMSPTAAGTATPFREVKPGLGLPIYANAEREPVENRAKAYEEAEKQVYEITKGAPVDELEVDAYATDDSWETVAAWYAGKLGGGWEKSEEDLGVVYLKTDKERGEILGVSVAHHSPTGRTGIGFMRAKSKALTEATSKSQE